MGMAYSHILFSLHLVFNFLSGWHSACCYSSFTTAVGFYEFLLCAQNLGILSRYSKIWYGPGDQRGNFPRDRYVSSLTCVMLSAQFVSLNLTGPLFFSLKYLVL